MCNSGLGRGSGVTGLDNAPDTVTQTYTALSETVSISVCLPTYSMLLLDESLQDLCQTLMPYT